MYSLLQKYHFTIVPSLSIAKVKYQPTKKEYERLCWFISHRKMCDEDHKILESNSYDNEMLGSSFYDVGLAKKLSINLVPLSDLWLSQITIPKYAI